MNKKLLRTFISVPVPNQLFKIRNYLKSTVKNKKVKLSWIKKENIHLTIKFIGDMPEDDISNINSVIKNIVEITPVMDLTIRGTGCFPKPQRPRILWLGVQGELEPLQKFVLSINEALHPLGYPKEENDFIPHITLSRIKYPQKFTPDISELMNYEYPDINFRIDKIHIMSSELFFNGSVYTILGTHYLS